MILFVDHYYINKSFEINCLHTLPSCFDLYEDVQDKCTFCRLLCTTDPFRVPLSRKRKVHLPVYEDCTLIHNGTKSMI